MKITVCIPAYRPNTLDTPVQSLLNQTWDAWEILIVGQGNKKDSRTKGVIKIADEFSQKDTRIKYVHSDTVGHSNVINKGVQTSTGEIIALIDDDCEAQKDWLEKTANYYKKYPNVGLIGGSVLRPEAEKCIGICPYIVPSEVMYDPIKMSPPDGWDWISANVSFRKEVFALNGPFDPYIGPGTIFPAGGETDYKLRLEQKGVAMLTTPKVAVLHKYGYRYGIKAIMQHTSNYAIGNGGLAGKLTLMGDERGQQMLEITKRERLFGWKKPFRPHRIPFSILRLRNYINAYNYCIKNYGVKNELLFRKR